MGNKLLIFGLGYTAKAVAKLVHKIGWYVVGTSRQVSIHSNNEFQSNLKIIDFDYTAVNQAFSSTSHILVSTPPDKEGNDPVLKKFRSLISNYAYNLKWIGYLSTTGVYGDHQGAWVDESTPVKLENATSKSRFQSEVNWLSFGNELNIATQVFRLAGIYGPERNLLRQLQNGTAKNIYKKGQVFSRIHVDDIANIVVNSMLNPEQNEIYNVCDDLPASTNEVIEYAAKLLNIPAPARIDIEDNKLSEKLKEFYNSNKKVKNNKIKTTFGINLIYPTYQEGLKSMYKKREY